MFPYTYMNFRLKNCKILNIQKGKVIVVDHPMQEGEIDVWIPSTEYGQAD